MIRFASAFVLLAGLATLSQLKADSKNPNYNDDVLPILRQHCVSCHGDDKQKGGLHLGTYTEMKKGGSSGDVVIAGDADKSRIYTLSAHKEEPKMPPNSGKIEDAKLNLLKLWIEQGAKETANSKVTITPKPKLDMKVTVSAKGKPDGPPPMPKLGLLPVEVSVKARRSPTVLGLAASPWAPLVAIGGNKSILLYNTDTLDLIGVLPFNHGQINSLTFSRSGKLILAAGGRGGQSGKAVLYEIETGKVVTEVGVETDALLSADLSPDQTQIAVGSPSKIVRCYSTADGSVLREIKKHTDWVTAVAFSPDGVLLATGDRNGGLFAWESGTGREFHNFRGHTAGITEISWRADGNVMASSGEDQAVQMWEMENGRSIKRMGTNSGNKSVRFAPDGTLASIGRDAIAIHWDAAGNQKKSFERMPDVGTRVVFSHDGSKLILGDHGGNLRVVNVADGKTLGVLDGNPAPLMERIKQTETELEAAKANVKVANANVLKAQQALTSAKAGTDGLAKALELANTTAKTATDTVALEKANVAKLLAAKVVVEQTVLAKDTVAAAYNEAAKSIQAASAKSPANAELAAAAKKAAELAKASSDEAGVAKKALVTATAGVTAATAKLVVSEKAVATTAAAAAEAKKRLEATQGGLKAPQDAVNAAIAAEATAKATVDALEKKLTGLKATIVPKK